MVYPGDRDYPTGNALGLNRIVLHEGRWRTEAIDRLSEELELDRLRLRHRG